MKERNAEIKLIFIKVSIRESKVTNKFCENYCCKLITWRVPKIIMFIIIFKASLNRKLKILQ